MAHLLSPERERATANGPAAARRGTGPADHSTAHDRFTVRAAPGSRYAAGVRPRPDDSRSITLALAEGGAARIAVVADTHGRPHPRLASRLRSLAPQAILHAGDIGDLAVLDALADIAPVHAVRGNVDDRRVETPNTLVIELQTNVGATRLLLTHIALAGVRLLTKTAALARAHGAELVVCGHSHVPFIGRHGALAVFNPGSAGPRRFPLPILFGTIDLSARGLRLGHIDCETGRRWRPPR